MLRRHGLTTVKPGRLTMTVKALVAGQAAADSGAGLDWNRLTIPASRLMSRCAGRTRSCQST